MSQTLSLPRAQRLAPRAPLLSRLVLLVVFLCLLGGRFNLERLSADLPPIELRFVGLTVALLLYLIWQVTTDRPDAAVRTGIGGILFTAWLWYMAASALRAPPGSRIIDNLLDLFFLGAFVALGWAVVARSPGSVDRLWSWFAAAGAVYLIAALAAGPDVQGRFAALGGGPNVFVRVMVVAALAVTYLAAVRGATRLLWLLPAFAVGAVMSGSRGGLLAFAAVVLVGGWPMLRRMNRRTARRLLLLTGASVVAALLVLPRVLGADVLEGLQYRFVVLTFEQGYSSGRSAIWADAWEAFTRAPVFGVGLDGYYGLFGRFSGYEYPHNILLAVLGEGGVVGVVLLGLAIVAFGATARAGRSQPVVLYCALAALYLALASMSSGDYYDSRLVWFFLGLAAIEARRSFTSPRGRELPATESW